MTTAIWIIVVLICLVGGIWLGRYTAPGVEKAREMEQERDEANAELQRYREDVRTHFEKTAHLFNSVTGSYRQLYEHLASGSERLGTGENSGLLETKPEERQLQGPDDLEGESKPTDAEATDKAETETPEPETPEAERQQQTPESQTEEQGEAEPARRTDGEAPDPTEEEAPKAEDVKPPRDHADTDEEAGVPEDYQRRA